MRYNHIRILLSALLFSIVDQAFSQPVIDYYQTEVCFNEDFLLRIVSPSGQPVEFLWEYSNASVQFVDNHEGFLTFNNGVMNRMAEQPRPETDFSFDRVSSAVYSTDYSYMKQYYKYYLDDHMQKGSITSLLYNGIVEQKGYLLSENEKSFLSSYYLWAAYEELSIAEQLNLERAPYKTTFSNESWNPIGISNSADASIIFNPEKHIQPKNDFTVLRVRVHQTSPSSGQMSAFIILDIKPRPPIYGIEKTESCPGYASGTIKLTNVSSIVNKPYRVLIDDGAGGVYESFSASEYTINRKFASGKYSIGVVYDDPLINGCYYETEVTITNAPPPDATITMKDASCPEKSDGEINISNVSYKGSYEISVAGNTFNNRGGIVTGLDGGKWYEISIRDECAIVKKSKLLGEPVEVAFSSINPSDPTCKSVPNGSFTVNVTGGNGWYNYKVSSRGTEIQNRNGETGWSCGGLKGDTYQIEVSSGGCASKVSSTSLKSVDDISFTYEVTDVDCFGQNTGKITVNASGGQAPYLYSIGNGSKVSDNIFQSLAGGGIYYTIKVYTHDQECNDYAEKQVPVGSSPEMKISMTGVDLKCFQTPEGSVSASVSGGNGGYSYSWTRDGYYYPGTGNTITNLLAGTYRLRVTDMKNCQSYQEKLISEPDELRVISAIPENVVCFGEKGSIIVNASGGTGSYSYTGTLLSGVATQSNTSRINLPAGQYIINVTDANSCESVFNDYQTVTVSGPSTALDFNSSLSDYNGFNLSCNADASGRITILPSGGNGSGYSGYAYYLNSAPLTGNAVDHLAAGSYTIGVKDGRGCLVQKNVTLSQPDPVSLNLVSVKPVKCYGIAAGEIIVSASGGIQNTYNYLVNASTGSPDGYFRNLYPGAYNIQVTDKNGCTRSLQTTVANLNPKIQTSLSKQDVLCFAAANGRINAGVTGGAGGFAYSWERKGSPGWQSIQGSSAAITDLAPGFYRLKATDAESCFAYDSISIAEPARLVIDNVQARDAVCYGDNGILTIQAAGGTGTYRYLVSGSGFNYDGPSSENALPPGNYTIKVKDANACETSFSNEVIVDGPPSALSFSGAVSSFNGYAVSCYGSRNGEISITATGGNGGTYSGYEYAIETGSWQANPTFADLEAGSYLLKVRDARGCTNLKTFTLNEPSPVELSLLNNYPVRCFGQPQGGISVRTAGGVQDSYSYSLNGLETSSAGQFSNLYAGTYLVGVKDKNGCNAEITSVIEHKNPVISLNLLASDVKCNGESNGSLRAELSGGAGGFSCQWSVKSAGAWQNVQGNTEISGLLPGMYRLKGTDSDNCSITDSTYINEPEPLVIRNVKALDAVCLGDSGSIEMEAAGGNNGYMFQTAYEQESTYHDYTPGKKLIPGSYRLKVMDLKACEALKPEIVTITKPDQKLAFTAELKSYNGFNVSCHGNNDGEITIAAFGGNGYGYEGYKYILAERPDQPGKNHKGLAAGTYNITVIDGRGCTTTGNAVLNEPPATIGLQLSSFRNPVCSYDINGEVSLLASGGVEPYSWSVNNGQFIADSRFTGLGSGNYLFRVRDVNGCGNELGKALVSSDGEMLISGLVSDARCFGENSGSISVHPSGGSLPYSYSWSSNILTGPFAEKLGKGDYTVIVTDSAGCRSQKSFHIGEPPAALTLNAVTKPACVGLKDGEIQLKAEGGTSPYMYALGKASDFSSGNIFHVRSGSHKLYASDINGCLTSAEVEIGVRNVLPDQNFMIATSRYELDTLVVIDVSVPRPDRTVWEFSPEASVIDTTSSVARVKYNVSGIYPVKMTGWFSGCVYTAEKLLNIAPFDPFAKEQDKYHKGIKNVRLLPNPNDGHFRLEVDLYTREQVNIRIFDYNARLIFDEKFPACTLLNQEINLKDELHPGTYWLWVICEDDARTQPFVISR